MPKMTKMKMIATFPIGCEVQANPGLGARFRVIEYGPDRPGEPIIFLLRGPSSEESWEEPHLFNRAIIEGD